jgi:uncharacterized protein YecE (DUF72 family)
VTVSIVMSNKYESLENKILALLIQLPPSMGIVEGMNGLRDIIPELDKRFRYAIEVS